MTSLLDDRMREAFASFRSSEVADQALDTPIWRAVTGRWPAFFAALALWLLSTAPARASQDPPAAAPQTLAYGAEPLQALDFWRSRGTAAAAPLVVFVHGGGWQDGDKRGTQRSQQVPHFRSAGYAFASLNYRLVPAVNVETQAQDVAMALKYLLERATSLGFDRKRVVLMGHSAGAHLAALVGTDGRYLETAGLRFGDLAGIVLLDGAGYDVAAQLKEAGPRLRRTYREAFGSDPARQRALSPLAHAAAPNARSFLILHVARSDSAQQARALGEALRAAGAAAEVRGLSGRGLSGHLEINVRLGDPSYPGTAIVDRWLGTLW